MIGEFQRTVDYEQNEVEIEQRTDPLLLLWGNSRSDIEKFNRNTYDIVDYVLESPQQPFAPYEANPIGRNPLYPLTLQVKYFDGENEVVIPSPPRQDPPQDPPGNNSDSSKSNQDKPDNNTDNPPSVIQVIDSPSSHPDPFGLNSDNDVLAGTSNTDLNLDNQNLVNSYLTQELQELPEVLD